MSVSFFRQPPSPSTKPLARSLSTFPARKLELRIERQKTNAASANAEAQKALLLLLCRCCDATHCAAREPFPSLSQILSSLFRSTFPSLFNPWSKVPQNPDQTTYSSLSPTRNYKKIAYCTFGSQIFNVQFVNNFNLWCICINIVGIRYLTNI